MKRLFASFCFSILALPGIFALDHPVLAELNDRSTPFFLGEESFRTRIALSENSEDPLGLLLSGGSARAYAHIGVLRRLEEADIHPDFLVANSMGAIVALLYAAGLSPDDIESLISSTPLSQLFQPELPLNGGILDPSAFMDVLYNLFGDLRIEDLPVPIIVVCDDLVTRRQVWFAEGDFYMVMRAAFAMPVYFDPVREKEFRLVDGGISNLVPVNILAEFTDRMLAAATFYHADNFNYSNPITIINLNFSLSKERSAISMIQEYKPYLIRCDVEDISFMDYANLEKIIQRGYNTVDRDIDSILAAVGTNPKDMADVRIRSAEKLKATQRRLLLGRSLYRKGPRFSAKLSIAFPESYGSSTYLLKDPYFSGGLAFGMGYFGGELAAASTFVDVAPQGLVKFKAGPFGPVDITTLSLVSSEGLYAQGEITAKFLLPGNSRIIPFAASETATDSDFSVNNGYHRSGIRFDFTSDTIRTAFNAYAFYRNPEILGAGGEASVGYSPVYPFEIRARTAGRIRISGDGVFPVFAIDGYRGALPEGTDIPHVISNFELALNLDRLTKGFAETILLQRVDTAVFFDLLAQPDGDALSYAAGISLTGRFSLIGLKPFSASLSSGWDFTADAMAFSLKLGSLF